MANEMVPHFDPAEVTTCHCEAAVTGARFVAISGPAVAGLKQVSHASAGGAALGVAGRDAAAGAAVTVHHVGEVDVLAGEAITAGDLITPGAAGVAMIADTAGNVIVGVAVDDAANAALARIRLSVASGAQVPA